jgi:class 3 adenylate cyclase
MGKNWSASLSVSAVVSLALLALYKFTTLPQEWAFKLEDFYRTIFLLPPAELVLRQAPQYVYIVVMALVTTWVCMELRGVLARVAYLIGAVFLTFVLSALLSFSGLLFEPYTGVAAIVLAGMFGLILSSTEEGLRQRKLHRYFVGRVSVNKFQDVCYAKDKVDLTGKREITVLTCRILNYPELSTQSEPQDLEQIVTSFLGTTSEFLASRGAYLDTCNAEGIRAFFGMLEKSETHAADASRVALELRKELTALEQEVQKRWSRKPVFGIALASGPMTAGLFGTDTFQGYSAVGEALDFSRRLCSINLVYGSQILLSARTYALTKEHVEARPMEMVFAPRMHQISEVYELLAAKGALNDEEVKARDAFWQGVVNLRKGDYKEATLQLKKARIDGREDAPLKYFLERAEAGMRDDAGAAESKPGSRHMRMLTAN